MTLYKGEGGTWTCLLELSNDFSLLTYLSLVYKFSIHLELEHTSSSGVNILSVSSVRDRVLLNPAKISAFNMNPESRIQTK